MNRPENTRCENCSDVITPEHDYLHDDELNMWFCCEPCRDEVLDAIHAADMDALEFDCDYVG